MEGKRPPPIPPRRSERSNVGQPPDRYGHAQSTPVTQRNQNVGVQEHATNEDSLHDHFHDASSIYERDDNVRSNASEVSGLSDMNSEIRLLRQQALSELEAARKIRRNVEAQMAEALENFKLRLTDDERQFEEERRMEAERLAKELAKRNRQLVAEMVEERRQHALHMEDEKAKLAEEIRLGHKRMEEELNFLRKDLLLTSHRDEEGNVMYQFEHGDQEKKIENTKDEDNVSQVPSHNSTQYDQPSYLFNVESSPFVPLNRDKPTANTEAFDPLPQFEMSSTNPFAPMYNLPPPPSNIFISDARGGVLTETLSKMAQTLDKLTDVRLQPNVAAQVNSSAPDPNRMDAFMARQSIRRELPHFSGNPVEWPQFIAQYRRTTASCRFSPEENMERLGKCLSGKAKESVQALLPVAGNSDAVIKVLERRFGRPAYIIETLIEKARLVPVQKEDKLELIIDFANVVSNLAMTMKSLECEGHLQNPQLLKELVAKLPASMKLRWGEKIRDHGNKPILLTTFSEWLNDVADGASYVTSFSSSAESKPNTDKKFGGFKSKGSVLLTNDDIDLVAAANDQGSKSQKGVDLKPKVCYFCEKTDHLIPTCKLYLAETVDARWKWLKTQNLCYGCLKKGHRSRECRSKKPCKIEDCKKLHHASLHFVPKVLPKDKKTDDIEGEKDDFNLHASSQPTPRNRNAVFLKILPVHLKGPAGVVQTFALLDEGSTVTMLDATLANRLGLKGTKTGFRWKGIGNSVQFDSASQIVPLKVSSVFDKTFHDLRGVRTIANLSLPIQSVSYKSLKVWKDNKNVDVEELRGAKPMILIGQDHGDLIVSREVIDGPSNSPVLSRTRLGWVIHGASSVGCGQRKDKFSFHISHTEEEDSLHRLVKEFFSTDTFGVKILTEGSRSREDRIAEVILKKTTKRIGSQFETGLLWRNGQINLPESKIQALHRLHSIERKMDKNPEFSKLYCDKIEDYLVKGFIRQLSNKEIASVSNKTWYLPHFGVWNHNKPGKFRLVFDAASKSHGVCLNDALYTGPDYLKPLPSVLFRFRRQQIGFIGDIGEMFHMVKVIHEDQQAQRFLWRGTERKKDPDVFVMQVMTFGAACSPTSAQYVKNLNAEEFRSEFPQASTAIVEGHYVDDYPDSADSVQEAIGKIHDVIEVHRRGGFNIRNWICSNPEVLESIPAQLRSNGVKDLSLEMEMPVERVLGLRWDPNTDQFLFVLNFHKVDPQTLDGKRRPTKREVLTLVMSIFDPMGFLACFVVKGKIILQDIWRSGVGWDDKITDEAFEKWKVWLLELKSIVNFRIPRCYFPNPNWKQVQLHVFCDASVKAFACVAFLRILYDDEIRTSFVTAKTRVAPIKPMSVPRLELQGALMASRLSKAILTGHDIRIEFVHFWTDSKTVLGWIRSDARRFKTFVSHRIGEISELTDITQWHFVPAGLNVADEATRDCKQSDFGMESRWINGPDFLQLPCESWPQEEQLKKDLDFDGEEEVKKEFVAAVQEAGLHLPDVHCFSSWMRLIRVTAWVQRFVTRFCLRYKTKNLPKSPLFLEPEEIENAETLWIKKVQQELFPAEISLLMEGARLPGNSRLATLSPILDKDGILRVKGRIERAEGLSQWIKQPVILGTNHPYTRLLLDYYHRKAGHHGQEGVFNEMRQKYWVIDLRQAIRSTWSRCIECKIKRSQPLIPEMGSLPACRLTPLVRPFTFTGVDYFGPMLVTVKRSKVKRYGVLFTCLTTRAVHLEIADYLNTDSAIMAIRRFLARRGQPKQMWSDNGTNFKGADRELTEALAEFDQEKICDVLSPRKIQWHFIPPASPHMGGCWERLVKSVKIALKSILHEQAPQQEVLATVFAEAEHMVNSRPLTHVSVDPNDTESLTPNHLLLSSSNGEALNTPGIFHDSDLCLRRQWRISQRFADHFWKRWIREYLPTLTQRTKWHRPATPVKVDDLVVIVDENLPRNTWLRGIIVAVFPGLDGQVRVVEVKTCQGIYRRPVTKICVLDLKVNEGDENQAFAPLGGMLASPPEGRKE